MLFAFHIKELSFLLPHNNVWYAKHISDLTVERLSFFINDSEYQDRRVVS